MTRREKSMVAGGAAALVLFAGYQLLVRPAAARARTLRRVVAQDRTMLAKLTARAAEYQRMADDIHRVGGKTEVDGEKFDLLSFVQRTMRELGLAPNVVDLTPSTNEIAGTPYAETAIELRMENLSMQALTNLLEAAQTERDSVVIRTFRLKRSREGLDANVRFATLTVVEEQP